jgi:hypothetical protein
VVQEESGLARVLKEKQARSVGSLFGDSGSLLIGRNNKTITLGRPFKHHDCWVILKDCAKFLQRDDDKEKDDMDAGHSSSAVSIGPGIDRPLGQKKVKHLEKKEAKAEKLLELLLFCLVQQKDCLKPWLDPINILSSRSLTKKLNKRKFIVLLTLPVCGSSWAIMRGPLSGF